MLNISGLQEGVVLDHIQAGKSLDIYYHLGLDRLTDCLPWVWVSNASPT